MPEPGMRPNHPRVRWDWEGYLEGQLPPRAPCSLIGRERVGGSLGQWDWGSENAGMNAVCLSYYCIISEPTDAASMLHFFNTQDLFIFTSHLYSY